MDRWMDKWMNIWINGWIEGLVDDGCKYADPGGLIDLTD